MQIYGNTVVQGASRGIGLQLVRELAGRAQVDRVVATCRRPGDAEELQALASSASNIRVLGLDVTQEETVRAACQHILSEVGELHGLFNVAGVLHGPGMRPERRLAEVTPEALLHGFQVNAFGPLWMAKHLAEGLAHGKPAVVANLSARVGSIEDNRQGGWYTYRASKAAQNQITKTLSIELRRRNPKILVVALHPGTVATDLSAPFQKNVPEHQLFSVERAARQLLEVVDGLDHSQNGRFFAWDGQPIPW